MLVRSKNTPNFEAARRHLELLLGDYDRAITWQVFDDAKMNPSLAACFHGTLDEVLPRLKSAQQKGCGVFISVNETDGKGRRKENMRKARALFLDLDGTPLPEFDTWPIAPHLFIRSSSVDGVKKYQCWWFIKPTKDWDMWQRAQKALALRYGGDLKCTLITQVGRCAGFFHQKRRDQPYRVEIDRDFWFKESKRYRFEYLVSKFGFDLSTIDLPPTRDQVERPPPMHGWDNDLDVAAAQSFAADKSNWRRTSDGGVSVFKMACWMQNLGISEPLAIEMIREHIPVHPNSWPDDHIESKVSNAYRYARSSPGARSVEADRQHLSATLIDRGALSDFLGEGDDHE